MKSALLIGVVALVAGCATTGSQRETGAVASHWQGYLLRDGLRSPIAVDLSGSEEGWGGRLIARDNAIALERVRVTASRVHFELPGEGVFDGSIADNEMAGAVTGEPDGSFWLVRSDNSYSPYPNGP